MRTDGQTDTTKLIVAFAILRKRLTAGGFTNWTYSNQFLNIQINNAVCSFRHLYLILFIYYFKMSHYALSSFSEVTTLLILLGCDE